MTDSSISPKDIPTGKHAESVDEAMILSKDMLNGEYIALRNQNNLSNMLIYRRTMFSVNDLSVLRWDGVSEDISWYNENSKTGIYLIANAEQLRGLYKLVASGKSFEGKTIRLMANINLGYHEWSPIGGGYEVEAHEVGEDITYSVKSVVHPFSGIFDGNGHTIYGLTIHQYNEHTKFSGLFGALSHATIKSLVLEGVNIGNNDADGGYAGVFGYAESCSFLDIIISGMIRGKYCGGLGCIAIDSSFYNCTNRAELRVKSDSANANLVVGGMVQQIGLSDKMIATIHQKEPNIFVHCFQHGSIKAYLKDATSFVGGHLYGLLARNPNTENHSIIINRCEIGSERNISIYDYDITKTKCTFFGDINGDGNALNHVSGIGSKVDMLDGLLGKTSADINVTVIKVTSSMIVDSMVLPGSVNTLKSSAFNSSFVTVDTSNLREDDGIANLEPYFTYVKTAN